MAARKFIESREEIERILMREMLRYLGLSLNGEPSAVPVSWVYDDGRILFHGSLKGKKRDHMLANPRVCFTVAQQSGPPVRHPEGVTCHTANDSAICIGTARILENLEERQAILNAFDQRLQPDAPEISPGWTVNAARVLICRPLTHI